MSFAHKYFSGLIWSGGDILFRRGIYFIVSIFLARLLTPDDFGLLAVLLIFIAIAELFVDGGFSTALIQNQNTSLIDESTVFFFNVGSAAIMAIILSMSAPLIANFFDKPMLQFLTYMMALNIFISGGQLLVPVLLSLSL